MVTAFLYDTFDVKSYRSHVVGCSSLAFYGALSFLSRVLVFIVRNRKESSNSQMANGRVLGRMTIVSAD